MKRCVIRRFFERAGVALAAAMLLLSGLARAQESAPPVSLDALDREIATRIDAAATPGAVVVVVENGAVVLSKGYGFADREAGAPMTTQTLVAAGSLSKNLTSLGVLALVEQGRLSLKDPLSARAPAVEIDNPWEAEHPILIEHVLEHTAGLEGSTYYEYGFNQPGLSPTDYARMMAGKIAVGWPPGFFYSYANPGHTLAGAAIEAVCACSYDDFMAEEVLGPVGMADASFSLSPEQAPRLANSYRADGVAPSGRWEMGVRPSGSLLVTAEDLGALVKFYATRGEGVDIISEQLFIRMENAETSATARAGVVEGGYSLGNFGFFAGKGKIFHGHTGGTDGFRTWMGYDPDTASGFAVVTNGGPPGMRSQLMRLIGGYLLRDLEPAAPAPAVGGAERFVEAGWYAPFTHEMPFRAWLFSVFGAVKLTPDGDGLALDPIAPTGSPRRLVHVGEGRFRTETRPIATAAMVDGPDGARVFVEGEAYARISVFAAYGAFYLFAGGLVVGALVAAHAVFWIAMRVFGRLEPGAGVRLRAGLAVSGACLVALVAMFVTYAMLADVNTSGQFGRPGALPISLSVMSVVGPAALLFAGVSLAQTAPGRAPLRLYGLVGLVFLGGAWALTAVNGWVPFVSWRI